MVAVACARPLPILPSDLRLGDLDEVVGQDTPADVAAHPIQAKIRAAKEPIAAAQDADPSFDPRPNAKVPPKPAFPFALSSFR